ncbi:MAG TPA: MopE-related protein, partial [Polyangiaceae bacterium]|nr:MopE-related protein [Polyangiaceae bacterium]
VCSWLVVSSAAMMREALWFSSLLWIGCADPVSEQHALPASPSDAAYDQVSSDGQNLGDGSPAGDAHDEMGPWPGMCHDGDEETCYSGSASTRDVGACRHGTHVCVGGKFPESCDGEILPAEETCNGIDDNCDGTVDEGCNCQDGTTKPCYGGAPGTEGVGPCKAGTQSCVGGTWGPCVGAVLPGIETCNGIDDDCNGVVDDKIGLKLYSMPFSGSAWSSQWLSEVWTGTHAPPRCADVRATAFLSDINRLLVFTADGKLYWQKNGAWMPPIMASDRFPSLPTPVDAVYQLPLSLFGSDLGATLTFGAVPYAYQYVYDHNDGVTKGDTFPILMQDGTSEGGPNQNQWPARWSLEYIDPSLWGQSNDAVYLYFEHDDHRVYKFNAAFVWTSWPVTESPLWSGKAYAPSPGTCVAGFAEQNPKKAYLVCP